MTTVKVKKKSQLQEKSVAKDLNARTVVASGALSIIKVSGIDIIVDTEDLPLLSNYYLKIADKNKGYVIARTPMKDGKRKSISLGRLLLCITDPNILVDHKDRNVRNYSKSNLRPCTRSENQSNRVFNIQKTSKYKGVSFDSPMQKWKVSLKYKGKKIHGGYFDDEKEAALRYNILAYKYFGEFAVLNEVFTYG